VGDRLPPPRPETKELTTITAKTYKAYPYFG
jgi:hypothetical protein